VGTTYMRPTDYYDVDSNATNEANVYDDDASTYSTVAFNLETSSVKWGQDSGNSDAWGAEVTGDEATAYCTIQRNAGTGLAGLYAYLMTSAGSLVGTFLAEGVSAVAKTTYAINVTAYMGDIADLRLVVGNSNFIDNVSAYVYEFWVEGKTQAPVGKKDMSDGIKKNPVPAGTSFDDSLTRMRRRLRDPNGNIWSDQLLRYYWNDVQRDVLRKMPELLCRWESQPFPQFIMEMSYIHDWEYRHVDPDKENYQAMAYWQEGAAVVSFPWEPGYPDSQSIADDGYRNMLWWEAGQKLCGEPARIFLDRYFHEALVVTYDEDVLEPLTESEAAQDRFYKTSIGDPIRYYRPDDYSNSLIMWPRPSSITFNETTFLTQDLSSYSVTEDWEASDFYVSGVAYRAYQLHDRESYGIYGVHGWEYSTEINAFAYSYSWEDKEWGVGGWLNPYFADETSYGIWGTQAFEYEYVFLASTAGPNSATVLERTPSRYTTWLTSFYGGPDDAVVIEKIDDTSEEVTNADHMTIIYRYAAKDIPEETASWGEFLPYPVWAVKYLEAGVLERAYGADTDGFIPSLRDYWALRYRIGIQILRRFVNASISADRRFVVGKTTQNKRYRHPTLPSAYPRVYP